jgi:23S rRNA pseudouridine1911/1915/1917 synthase
MAKNAPFTVIYEDNHLLIVNKEPGVLVQGDKTRDKPLVDLCKDYVKEKYDKPGAVFMGLVHRLDRPVSGAVVLARTSKALERMNRIFSERKVKKTYWAVVKNRPKKKSDQLVHWLKKDSKTNTTTVFEHAEDGAQKAILSYELLGHLNDHYLLEVTPTTGRPHQIRAQLASIGCPIRGDIKYGFDKPNPDKSINLHAKRLEFLHPVKKEPVIIQAGFPNSQFWEQYLALDKVTVKDKHINHFH